NPGVRIDVEMMGQMTGGLSKAHYRLLSYLRSRGENRLDIETALEAAGARRSRYYPSDALKAFASAYTVMQRYRHITRPPDAERRPDGSYDLVFDWGDPVELPARADTLFRDLLEIGIRPAEAESMIQQDPRKVGALIQALRIG